MPKDRTAVHVRGILVAAVAHFVVALLIAVVAFGLDMDQLSSRTPWSRVAAVVHDVLWLPHDRTLRAVPNAWLIRNQWIIPTAIVFNSLAWGVVLHAAWHRLRRRPRRAATGAG